VSLEIGAASKVTFYLSLLRLQTITA